MYYNTYYTNKSFFQFYLFKICLKLLKNLTFIYKYKMTDNKNNGIPCSQEDYLDEDPIISNQLFACLSIFTPNSVKSPEGDVIDTGHKVRAFKIRGVYASHEKAEKRCEEIRKFDKYHHVFVGELGKWLPWDDDASNAEEAVYAEPKLNEMMKAYKDSQAKAAEYAEERKMQAHAEAMKKKKELAKKSKEESSKNVDPDGLKNDIITRNIIEENINSNTLTSDLIEDQEKLNEMSKNVKEGQVSLNEEQEVINSKEETISRIDEELEKAKKLYDDLMKKYSAEKSAH